MKTKRSAWPSAADPAASNGIKNGVPRHVAIIMDGNGRWARERGLPRAAGHRAGVETVREIVRASTDIGVRILTIYAFSQENWKRPREEVSILMNLLDVWLDREIGGLDREGVRIRAIGRLEGLGEKTLKKIRSAEERTARNEKLYFNIALNYGARAEILDAARRLVAEAIADPAKFADPESIDEAAFASRLYTAGLPDPDLLIRTSGEMRLSNFLLWQLSYAEMYITKKYWPDFTKKDYQAAIREYRRRERRFGDVAQNGSGGHAS
jgi:undecaprenyl diphosphate synthase